MKILSEIENLSNILGSLPGIGPKSSLRLAVYLAVTRKDVASRLSGVLISAINNISLCKRCFNITDSEYCNICANTSGKREKEKIMVIEDPVDLLNVETSGEYKGLYHVLGGIISPMNGIGPDELKINELISRIKLECPKEVIFALNHTLEGDTTAHYIKNEIIENFGESILITRFAKGIPGGVDIEFISPKTLGESIKARTIF